MIRLGSLVQRPCSSILKLECNIFEIARKVRDAYRVLSARGHVSDSGGIVESFFLSDNNEIRSAQIFGVGKLNGDFVFAEKMMQGYPVAAQ